MQEAYEISVTPPAGGPAWLSGRVDSNESVLVPWEAPPLLPHERRTVRVRAWGPGNELPNLDDPFEIGSGEHTFLAGCRAPEEDTRSEPTALDRALAPHTPQRQALQQQPTSPTTQSTPGKAPA
ncbi:hypothetical protein OG216_35615 [Streptomycetaceae bacterium NBC_01309]